MADVTQTELLVLNRTAETLLGIVTAVATTQNFHQRILEQILVALTAAPPETDTLGVLIASLNAAIIANTAKVAELVTAVDELPGRVGSDLATQIKEALRLN